MANEIGATGSRMLMANLQDRAIQDRSNQRRNSALAAMQADNLNRMAMDPDINDKSLSYYAAAQQADPSGIMGRIAGALGTIKGMEAQEKKNQAVADRRQRTNEYMGSALTDMLGRDLTDVEQAMVNDGKGRSILEMSDLKQRMEDADYARERRNLEDQRKDVAYQEEQTTKANLKSFVDDYAGSLADDNPLKEIMSSSMPYATKAELITKQMLKNASQAEIDALIQETLPILETMGLDPEAIKLAKQGKITPEMAAAYSQKVSAIASQPQYRDALRDMRDASMRYSQAASQAQEQVLNSMVSREAAEDALRQEGVEEGPDFQSQVDVRHRAMKSAYLNDEKNLEYLQKQVEAATLPQRKEMEAYNTLLGNYIKKNPFITELHKFQSEENMNRMFPQMQEGTVFQSPVGNYYKVGVGPDGQKIKVEATEDDIKDFRYNLFGIFQQDEEQPIVGDDDPLNNLPGNDSVGDYQTTEQSNADRSVDSTRESAKTIDELSAKYRSLLNKTVARGARAEAEVAANETGIASFFRNVGDFMTNPNFSDTEIVDALKYAGVPSDQADTIWDDDFGDLPGLDSRFSKVEKNKEIIKELNRRIKILEKAQ